MQRSQIFKLYVLSFLLCLSLILLFAAGRKARAGTEHEPQLILPEETASEANNQKR